MSRWSPQRSPWSRALGAVLFIALTVGSFAFFNSGARGVATCERSGFGGPGTLSWWRPGALCEGGEPQFAAVQLNAGFLMVPVALLVLAAAAWAVDAARRSAPM